MAYNMDNTMDIITDVDAWLTENPDFLDGANFDGNGLMIDTDSESLNPAALSYDNQFPDLNGVSTPQEVVPMNTQPAMTPQQQMPNMAMGPCYHPMIGWYYPAAQPVGIPPPPPPMIPVVGMTPVTSVPTTGTSTPIPQVPNPTSAPASQRTQPKRKYGPSAFLDAQAEGRTSISNNEVNYFSSSASRRGGRGDQVVKGDSFDNNFKRAKNRPSIVQACICSEEAQRIKRPKNPFVLYRLTRADMIRKNLGTKNNQDVSREAGRMWHNEPKEVKDHFKQLAEVEKQRHAEKYPDYVYKPGGQVRAKFGTKDCTCGAYQLNMVRFNEKRGGRSFPDDVQDSDADDAYIPTTRIRQQAPPPTTVMMPPPNLNIASLGLPRNQGARAEAVYAGMKRKHELTIATSRNNNDEQSARKRRSPRATVGSINYAEPNDDEVTFDLGADDLFDFGASCKTPSSTAVERFHPSPKDLRSSRNNSLRKGRQHSNDSNKSSPLLMSPPARNTRSQSRGDIRERSSSPLTPTEEVENPVATKKTRQSICQVSQASDRSVRSTRSKTSEGRSLRSSGGK